MHDIATRSIRTSDEYALPLRRKAIVVVGSEGGVPDCNLSAIEREFPWVSVERAVTIERACGHFDHPVQLVLIDESVLDPTGHGAGELAGRHPGALIAMIVDDSSTRLELVEAVLASSVVRSVLPMNLRLDIWLSVIRLMLRGGEYFPSSFFQKRPAPAPRPAPPVRLASEPRPLNGLTDREIQVLEMVSHGAQNKLIAVKLNLSEHTIKVHLHNIIKKLGARNRTAAAAIFLEQARAARHNADLSFALTGK
jgi:DNA-binding NarL/FixJ family response regulator